MIKYRTIHPIILIGKALEVYSKKLKPNEIEADLLEYESETN